jgi:hypothetical protein
MNRELPTAETLMQQVFSIKNEKGLLDTAFAVFRFQYHYNAIYKSYCDLIQRTPETVHLLCDIPFLPISFFKTHIIRTTEFHPEVIFESSGTTGTATSKHFIKDISLYKQSFISAFETLYGPAENWCILGLLPSYLEKGASSLVFMVDELIKKGGHPKSNFYLHDLEKLANTMQALEKEKQKTLVIGVTYALLDFAQHFPLPLSYTTVMETGGMKGQKREMVRSEVHLILKKAFSLQNIHSEYGMTELLSQAYAAGNGRFISPPWMRVLLRHEDDPLLCNGRGTEKSGAINIIDLANLYSCSFIATEDVGKLYSDGSFEVLGRLDNSDIRGCSLLAL